MKVKRKKSLNTQGFTMVELLVALVVSLLALGAIYSTFLNQFKSYQVQEEVAAMQQNIRAAMFHMQREIRMAGCDPTGLADDAGITAASATSIHFKEDVRGNSSGSDPDGATDDPNEDITYSLSDGNLVRNTGGGNQTVAENIDALNFVYLDGASPPAPLAFVSGSIPAGDLSKIRSVEITIVARTGRSLRASPNNMVYYNQRDDPILGAQNDNYSRKRLTTFINCRNLGLN
jgi:type IV pilus assembly protein PilW